MYQGKIPIRSFVERFFTFLMPIVDLQGQTYALKWQSDHKLKHCFQTAQLQNSQLEQACHAEDVAAIVESFLQISLQDSTPVEQRAIAQGHLAAYLEVPAYQAALNRFRAFKDYTTPNKTWEHYLHIAKCLALDSDKIVEIYHRYEPETAQLEQHFRLEFASKIRDIFHRETGQGKYSLWYSLKQVSERELRRRLSISGVKETKSSDYVAVRDALFEVYSKSGERWLEPNAKQYQQATSCFNQYYKKHQTLTVETFRLMLVTCIKVNQVSISIESLEDNKQQYRIAQAQLAIENPLIQLEEEQAHQDYQTRLVQIDQRLASDFQQFEEKDQQILKLHAQGMSQTEIARIVKINQGTVSRRYQRSQRELLSAIAQWMQAQYEISLIITEHLAAYVELWLVRQYGDEVPTRRRGNERAKAKIPHG